MPKKNEYEELKKDFLKMLGNMSSLIDLRNGYEMNHSQNVAKYAVLIAKEFGLSDEQIEDINYAALLHDIGKLEIKEGILTKPDGLTDMDWKIIADYPKKGAEAISNVDILKRCEPLILYHRQCYKDRTMGYPTGYPTEVEGEEIPLGARIISVAESYQAMISERPYRKALPKELVISEIKRKAGVQFCPRVVDAFLKVIEKEEKREL